MNKIGIVIQGPTNYFREILDCYKGYEYIVWSTWENEPIENINFIKQYDIPVIQSEIPSIKGNWNCNLQCISTVNGIEYLRMQNAEISYFIKVRGDMIIRPLNELIKSVNVSLFQNDLAFIGYFKAYPYTFSSDYFLMDFLVAGKYNEIIKFFTPIKSENIGLPFPEKWFEINYFGKFNFVKFNIEIFIKQKVFINSLFFNIYFFKEHLNSNSLRKINGIYVNKAGFLHNILYFLWILPKYAIKKQLKFYFK